MGTETPPIHLFEQLCSSDEDLHAMRYRWAVPRGVERAPWYMRNYALVGIVVAGSGRIHQAHGNRPLEPGDLYVVGPHQAYRIDPSAGEGMVEMRVLIRRRLIRRIRQRYASEDVVMPWDLGPLASHRALEESHLQWFTNWVGDLMDLYSDRLTAEAFVTGFLYRYRQVERHRSPAEFNKLTTLPAWLRAVLVEMNTLPNLRGGVEVFARLAGRSRRHLNRLCQQYFQCTSTAYINRLRMERAARELRFSDVSVEMLAERLGFSNRSYFSKLFTQAYGESPGRYRRK